MYSKASVFSAISVALASTVPSGEIFSQGGCVTSYTGPLKPYQQNLSYKCFTPTVSGRCAASFESYHYNPKSEKCEKSLFGGCNDGCQAFRTKLDCQNECFKFSIDPIDPSGIQSFVQSQCKVVKPKTMKKKFENVPVKCFVKTKTGKCRVNTDSYHYDAITERCVKSVFGGCDDGCLAFKTIRDCQDTCNRYSIDA
ncbi:hypothetical protein K502DRAFT_326631 [Neoconidiobolus thromboides FSU 785]|nr:hypothetical protein K502DRAFT_326631 [Neoconidiobolus thromboides FSU 785]